MGYFIALRWRYRVLSNIRAKLELVESLMRFRFNLARLKPVLDAQTDPEGLTQPNRDMERSIWRDYSYFRFCEDKGAELFAFPYDETASMKADELYFQILLGMKLHYRRLLKQTPAEWAAKHREKLRNAPVAIPRMVQEKRVKRGLPSVNTTKDEAKRKQARSFRQSVLVAASLLLFVVVNMWSGTATALPDIGKLLHLDELRGVLTSGFQRDVERESSIILVPHWLPWDDYDFSDISEEGIIKYSFTNGPEYIDFYLVPYGEYIVDTEEVFDDYASVANWEIKYLLRTDRPGRYYWNMDNIAVRVTSNLGTDEVLKVISFLSKEKMTND